MFDFLGFWVTSINGFIFPFVVLSLTLLDITTITGLLFKGEELPALFSLSVGDLGIQFSKSEASYSVFLATNAKSKSFVSDGKHHTFMLYWLYKYFICTNSVAIVFDYSYYVAAIVSNKPLALVPLFLSLLYRSCFTILEWLKSNEDVRTVLGLCDSYPSGYINIF